MRAYLKFGWFRRKLKQNRWMDNITLYLGHSFASGSKIMVKIIREWTKEDLFDGDG